MLDPTAIVLQEAPAPAGSAPPGDPAAGQGGSFLFSMLPFVAIIAIFYFLLIAPERKARKKREAMLKQIKKGDKVMTSGGMYGTVAGIQDEVVTLLIAEGVKVRFSRGAIQSVVEVTADAEPAKA
jgi:preprotein translocase subunit YajC